MPLTSGALPFDPAVISRLSLDGKPRSLSIRQGADVWLGYDLERATVFKVWQAPPGKPGLIKTTFVTRSAGKQLFEDTTHDPWTLQRGGKMLPLAIRYLGCTHAKERIELRWELKHDDTMIDLYEFVPLAAVPAGERVVRELRVGTKPAGDVLLPPAPVQKAWRIKDSSLTAITHGGPHRLTLS